MNNRLRPVFPASPHSSIYSYESDAGYAHNDSLSLLREDNQNSNQSVEVMHHYIQPNSVQILSDDSEELLFNEEFNETRFLQEGNP
jgi:hypothetical protein